MKKEVDAVFQRLEAGEVTETGMRPESGWKMSLPTGKAITRSRLQAEAQSLIALGPDAIPDLLQWVTNENPALRYVAVYALEQITGQKPYLPHFAQSDDDGYRAKAMDVWREWHKTRTRDQD